MNKLWKENFPPGGEKQNFFFPAGKNKSLKQVEEESFFYETTTVGGKRVMCSKYGDAQGKKKF